MSFFNFLQSTGHKKCLRVVGCYWDRAVLIGALKCAALCNSNNNNNIADLTIEIELTWYVKTKVIPVIIGATGTISKSLRKYPGKIQGKQEVEELQKTGIQGTAHTHTSDLLI